MASQHSEAALGKDRSVHEARRRRPVDPDVIAKAYLYDYSKEIDRVNMHLSLMLYAVCSIYLHFSDIDRTGDWVTLGDHKFKDLSHLSWLVRTFAFCFLEWLAALVEQEWGLSIFRVNISSGSANTVYAIGLSSTIVLLMDLTATVRYLIVEFWWFTILSITNSPQYSDIVSNLFWWFVIIHL